MVYSAEIGHVTKYIVTKDRYFLVHTTHILSSYRIFDACEIVYLWLSDSYTNVSLSRGVEGKSMLDIYILFDRSVKPEWGKVLAGLPSQNPATYGIVEEAVKQDQVCDFEIFFSGFCDYHCDHTCLYIVY